jgi:hypothetical protein
MEGVNSSCREGAKSGCRLTPVASTGGARLLGLPVQLMSKVPNWGFRARRPTDFVRRVLRDDWGKFTEENSNEISR